MDFFNSLISNRRKSTEASEEKVATGHSNQQSHTSSGRKSILPRKSRFKKTPTKTRTSSPKRKRVSSILGKEVEIFNSGKHTEEFLQLFHLILKSALMEQYRNIDTKYRQKEDPDQFLTFESLLQGIFAEILCIYENKKSDLDIDNTIGEFMPHIFAEVDKMKADRLISPDELRNTNLGEMKSMMRTESMDKPQVVVRSLNDYFQNKQFSKDRKQYSANLRKTIELGFLRDDPEIVKMFETIETYGEMKTEIQRANAFKKGRQNGFHLWNNAIKLFIEES